MDQSPHEHASAPEVLDVGARSAADRTTGTAPESGSDGHAADESTSGEDPPAARRGRRRLLVTAGVLSVALVGGGGALAASRLTGGGASPDQVVPASALGFVSVDLDPSAGQKLDAFRFARKFPDVAHRLGGGQDLPKALFQSLKGDGNLAGNWAKDVQPWLGRRAGLAVLPGTAKGKDPAVVVVIAVTDPARARAGIAKVTRGQASCAVTDEFAVCSDDLGVADRAVADARRSPLAERAEYVEDLRALGGDAIARAWVDLGRLAEDLPDESVGMGSAVAATGRLAESGLTGRAALSLGFAGPTLQLQGAVVGARKTGVSGTTSVTQLPADTVAAFGIGGVSELVRQAWSQARAVASDAGAGEALDEQVRQLQDDTGVRLPADLVAAVGSQATVAVGGSGDAPKVAVRLSGDDKAAGRLARAIEQTVGMAPATASIGPGRGTVLASDPAYARSVAFGSGLGGTKAFWDAVPGAAEAQSILFVDVARALASFSDDLDLTEQERSNLRPLAALGMSARQDGATARFTARLTTR